MTRADRFVVAFTLLLIPALYLIFWGDRSQGTEAEIRSETNEIITASLLRDQLLHVHGPLGTSIIEIKQGKIRFIESPCQGKQCIHMGWLDHNGEFSACLPNKISIAVLGNRHSGYDTINF